MSSATTTSARLYRQRLSPIALVAVLSLAVVGWWLSVGRMQGMDAGPGVALGALGWFAATWLLMMAAMMLPAIAPVLAVECVPRRGRAGSARAMLVSAAFLAAYLAVWALAGTSAYLVLRAGRAVAGGAFEWHRGGRWLAAAVLALAATYQLSATKRRWLARCRAPLTREDGEPVRELGQAARAGLRTGIRCLASSWALMAVLFALGAMSLVWMAVVSALIAAERLSPVAAPARIAAAGALLVLAVGVGLAPGSVPGLTVPGSPAATRAMARMSGMSSAMHGQRMGARHPMQTKP